VPDVIARAFVALPPLRLRQVIERQEVAAGLFKGIDLRLAEDRAEKGWRWEVHEPFHGSAEIWLEPALDGCVLHAFLRADDAEAARLDRRGQQMRSRLFAFKDGCESADS
jgi:hypothetical protein